MRDSQNPTPADTSELTDVLQFMRMLWAVVHALQKASKRMSRDVGVTGPQRLVLRVVGLFPGVSAGELSSILHVHPSTLTGILQRLVNQRLLTRTEHRTDRRRAVLALSARGAVVNATMRGTVEMTVRGVLKNASSKDRIATQRLLTALADQLQETKRA